MVWHAWRDVVLVGVEVTDVFLALELGKSRYSNLDFGAILAQQHASCGRLTPQSATEGLAPYLVSIGHLPRAPPSRLGCTPPVPPQAAAHFSNRTTRYIDVTNWRRYRRDRPHAERLTRLNYHLSQFAHMRTCAQLIQVHEAGAIRTVSAPHHGTTRTKRIVAPPLPLVT